LLNARPHRHSTLDGAIPAVPNRFGIGSIAGEQAEGCRASRDNERQKLSLRVGQIMLPSRKYVKA